MRLICLAFFSCLASASGQSHGYVFFGPGGVTSNGNTSSAAYVGAGGEGVFGPGVGIGGEIGYVTPWRSLDSGIGIGSVNGSFHFNRDRSVVPFVTAGYTLFFRSGHASGFNFGGGVNWWFSRRLGVKAEIRDNVGSSSLDGTHFWAVRGALIFR